MNIHNKPEPESIRMGAPYDSPAFEALCREMSIWGTAQAALCAVFWRRAEAAMAESIGTGGVSALPDAEPAQWPQTTFAEVLPFLSDRIVALITAYGDARADEDVPATVRTLADLIHEARRIMIAAPQAATDKDAEIAALKADKANLAEHLVDILAEVEQGAIPNDDDPWWTTCRAAIAQAVQPS